MLFRLKQTLLLYIKNKQINISFSGLYSKVYDYFDYLGGSNFLRILKRSLLDKIRGH